MYGVYLSTVLTRKLMAKRLSVKFRKQRRDLATAYAENKAPWDHKIARARSTKAKFKKINRMK